jgi:hypothetical protein
MALPAVLASYTVKQAISLCLVRNAPWYGATTPEEIVDTSLNYLLHCKPFTIRSVWVPDVV